MRIGLIDVDGACQKKKWGATVYPNLALCKIAGYYRTKGDVVEWADQMTHYDILYMAKVFRFSPDDKYIYSADKIIKGGTGYAISSRLPEEIDRAKPDYSIYPSVPKDYAYGFLTRGCPNKCGWCVVPKKEGGIKPYMDVDEIATPTRRKLVLMDNNVLAAGDYCVKQFQKIIDRGYRVDFNQALDARLLTAEHARLIAKMKFIKNIIRFGCDTHRLIGECQRAIDLICSYGYKGDFFLYMIINADFNEAFHRISFWWKKLQDHRNYGDGPAVYAYAQPYRNPNKNNVIPQWQKDLSMWVNKKMIFCKIPFTDFEPRKGFKCSAYLKQFDYMGSRWRYEQEEDRYSH